MKKEIETEREGERESSILVTSSDTTNKCVAIIIELTWNTLLFGFLF